MSWYVMIYHGCQQFLKGFERFKTQREVVSLLLLVEHFVLLENAPQKATTWDDLLAEGSVVSNASRNSERNQFTSTIA